MIEDYGQGPMGEAVDMDVADEPNEATPEAPAQEAGAEEATDSPAEETQTEAPAENTDSVA